VDFAVDGAGLADRLEPAAFAQLPAVSSVHSENGHIVLSVTEPHHAIPALLNQLQKLNRQLTSLSTRHASLEDVFVTLTGRHLSEERSAESEQV
jgi:ABC-2 type transport system ATP-binding protein